MGDESLERDKLKATAKAVVDAIPAETALGNRDPQGNGEGTPKDYAATHGDGPNSA